MGPGRSARPGRGRAGPAGGRAGAPCRAGRQASPVGAGGSRGKARGGDPFLAGPWCDAGGDGREVPWGEAILVLNGGCEPDPRVHRLWLGNPPGAAIDPVVDDPRPFVRDPDGVVGPAWRSGFERDARLPADAVSTGITNGRVTIWTSESAGPDALLLRLRDGRVERWPRAPHEVGCG